MSDAGVTRSYPEARGPHLPDALTRVAPLAYPFALLALFVAWRGWQDAVAGGDALTAEAVLRILIPSVVIPLLGLIVVVRRPDAHRTLRLLLFGVALLSLRELITTFDAPLRELLRGVDTTFEFESPGEIALRVFTGLLLVFGLLYLGAGVADARGPDRVVVERPLAVWLAALAAIAIALSLYSLVLLTQGDYPFELIVSAVIGLMTGALVTLCWAYIATIVIGGWLSGRAPRRAWIVGAIALVLLFGTQLIGIGVGAFATEALLPFFLAIAYAGLLGWVLLLVAFALGLPGGAGAPTLEDETATADPPAATPPGSAAG